MRAYVGSKNPIKLEAVAAVLERGKFGEMLQKRGLLVRATVGIQLVSAVPAQPRTLDMTIRGATHRAQVARLHGWDQKYLDGYGEYSDLGVGVESGVFDRQLEVPGGVLTVMMDVTVCVLAYEKDTFVGMSPSWVVPQAFSRAIRDGSEMDEAAYLAGATSQPHIGQQEGLVGVVSKGLYTRSELTKRAVEMAVIHWMSS